MRQRKGAKNILKEERERERERKRRRRRRTSGLFLVEKGVIKMGKERM